jgi:hypothetical protein
VLTSGALCPAILEDRTLIWDRIKGSLIIFIFLSGLYCPIISLNLPNPPAKVLTSCHNPTRAVLTRMELVALVKYFGVWQKHCPYLLSTQPSDTSIGHAGSCISAHITSGHFVAQSQSRQLNESSRKSSKSLLVILISSKTDQETFEKGSKNVIRIQRPM